MVSLGFVWGKDDFPNHHLNPKQQDFPYNHNSDNPFLSVGCSVANCGASPGAIAFDVVGFKELLQQPPRICHSPFNKSKMWGSCMAALCGVVIHFQK